MDQVDKITGMLDRETDDNVAKIRRKAQLMSEVSNRAISVSQDQFCEECGDPIEVARLIAVRGAKRCCDCQEEYERGS